MMERGNFSTESFLSEDAREMMRKGFALRERDGDSTGSFYRWLLRLSGIILSNMILSKLLHESFCVLL